MLMPGPSCRNPGVIGLGESGSRAFQLPSWCEWQGNHCVKGDLVANSPFLSHLNQPSHLPAHLPRILNISLGLPNLVETHLESTGNERPRTVASGED